MADSGGLCVDVMVVGEHEVLEVVDGVADGVGVALEVGTEGGFLAFVERVFVLCHKGLEVLAVVP